MGTIFKLTLKSATRDPLLLFWSLILPIIGSVSLGMVFKSPEYPLHILTGMMAVSIMFYSFMTTAYSIMGQRRRGVYNLLLVTPMSLWKYICSISAAWSLIAFLCGVLVFISGAIIFQINVSILSCILTISVVFTATVGYIFLSFFVASLSKTEANVSMITNILTLPCLFCSDAFYSLKGAPTWIQTISKFNPFQWFVSGLRSSLSTDWSGYTLNVGLLVVMCVLAFLLALRTFKYSEV